MSTGARFVAETVQVVSWLRDRSVLSHVCVSVTRPWARSKATGMTALLAPLRCGSMVIWPKYQPSGTPPAVIRIVRVREAPAARVKWDGETVMSVPAGSLVVILKVWDRPETFVTVRVVATPPAIGLTRMLGVLRSRRELGSSALAA